MQGMLGPDLDVPSDGATMSKIVSLSTKLVLCSIGVTRESIWIVESYSVPAMEILGCAKDL